MGKINSVEQIMSKDSTFGAESSYYFLMFYQYYSDWNVYSSDEFGLPFVNELTNLYSSLHGKVNISSKEKSVLSIWSADPLGIFRYKMDKENYWKEIGFLNKIEGYLVEGAYWNNGFFYRVLEKEIIQSKLFIDNATMISYSYPETKKISNL